MSPRKLRHRHAAVLAVAGAAILLAAPLRAQRGDDREPVIVCLATEGSTRLTLRYPFDLLCRRMCRWGWVSHIVTHDRCGVLVSIRYCTRLEPEIEKEI